MSELAEGWVETTIVEVLAENNNGKPFQQGWSPQCESHPAPDGDWGVLKTTAIQDGEYWGHENKRLPDHLEPKANVTVKAGDILMTCAGPRNRCGVTCLVERTQQKLMMSGKMYRFRPIEDVMSPDFLAYFLATREATDAIDKMKTGINDSGLNLTHGRFAQLGVRVAPLDEQRRIVNKIEQLFDLLDKGEESLRAARAKAGLYRQSLLKHAFEGQLTADWRAANPNKLEDPETLLTRIQEERDARYKQALDDWQDALAKWRADNEEGKRPAKPKRPPATERVDPPDNYHTCESWIWVSVLSLLRAPLINGRSVKDRADGFPVLRLTALKGEKLDLSEYKNGAWNRSEALPYLVEEGDFYVARGNGSKKLVGLGSLASNVTFETAFPDTMIRLRLDLGVVASGYFGRVWNSRILRDQIEEAARTTAGIYKINQDHISGFVFPLCSPAEQAEIVSLLEAKLSTLDALEGDIDTQLAKSRALRQSILKRAFEGKLVPQDPTDEPASALLERIKAERDAAPKPKRKRKVKA